MDAIVDYEGLDLHEGAAAAAGSFLAMALFVMTLTFAGGPDSLGLTILAVLIYATPIWLAGFLLVGLPVAVWIENRTPVGAPRRGRWMRYVTAGAVVGALLFLLHPIFLPATVAAAVGGVIGVELWRRWDTRHESAV